MPDDETRKIEAHGDARAWAYLGGKCAQSAASLILESLVRADSPRASHEHVKSAMKALDEAKEHLMRASIHYGESTDA